MKTVLMVAEKPSLAQSLAKILSNGNMSTKKGSNGACSIHDYTGRFNGESVHFKMTSVCGHVMGCDFPGKFNNWDKVDPVELFTAPISKKEANPNLHMPLFLRKEATGADYLVLWLDCDKEGENICFEVIDCVRSVMNRLPGQQIFRARFSAITDTDIKHAMNNLVEPNKNEALSVDARQELDLRIGCAFTRYQTRFFQGKYGDLDSTLISYGPCQTPTLGFCVERHDKIQSFKPEPYWVIHVQVQLPNGKLMNLDWERVRLFDKDVAQMFVNRIKTGDGALVLETVQKKGEKPKPLALNTVEMLRVASSGLGMGPQHTMQVAERLYTQGYISYPRTETNSYPENFDLRGTLKQQSSHPDWGNFVTELLHSGIQKPKKGHDAGDHPPITPMKSATESELDSDSWRLYDYITRHFIATISPNCTYLQTTIYFEIGSEKFSCSGKVLVDPGYTSIMPWQQLGADEEIPILKKDEKLALEEVKLVDKMTCPPDYLTESELITLMEKHGIGTDASIPVHINNICERNYVNIISGRKLKPTPLGIVLVHGYQKIDVDLVLPTMRSAVEQQLTLIAQGKADFMEVKQHAIDIFHRKFRYFVDCIAAMDELFEVTFSSLADSGRPLSRCGKCRRYMKFVQAKPSRLHCCSCDETFSLPQNGNIKLYKELKCPLDEFELVLWSTGAKGKTYPLCPYCYNNPPFSDMRKGMGCNECTHPTCSHAFGQNGVSECVECDSGVLVLDHTSGPKWRMACNKCSVVVHFFDGASRVSVKEDSCEECGANVVEVAFKEGKSPFPAANTEHSGCVFCDSVFKPLMEKHHAAVMRRNVRVSRGGRGRGRGGRGRGRGRGKPKDKMAQLAAYFV
ncbi:DNA topoisomerase 3-beta-1-like isoform X1 [Physella acuta]|uniref:DNA topoisomerase 3-beta-1-like isoform X1 n=2 Tax=Physella acuta TaxID=109671 RepID=UPI0027DBECCD|nr:DNA topoisomerase 3-beta-1-like isoform X1 [Physella acuta]XP_059150613.1 DNA topoisomerase 3-beta-1-like isoform X1 [Physella acuta]XP_059150614.1 DNA topoisomerase 3-beta-1-like isoform X1 [Physella acuta]XP_059150615.1 DNA topoisomerase 3-beta-1-like isoform X1 [Physella acuta]XP_059150616.1 DNA topoisomerase 3-beta-1-like isoform X1 [Physella acuta]XP_059150617.1 DNA topoisomerase 3-beta-1-like isoform X1 [Physella acuta]